MRGSSVGTSLAGAPATGSRLALGNEYWVHGTTALIVLFALVVVRVHELFPYLFAPLRPAWTVTIPLAFLLFRHSSKRVVAAAFAYPQTRLLLAFLGVAALTIPFAIWPGKAFSTCKGLLPAVLVFLGCMLVRPGRATLDRVQLAFVGLVLFFAAYQNIFAQSWAGRLRPLGGSYDGNDTAALMALSFPLAAGLLVRAHRGWPRVLASLAVVALVLIVVATGSRGGTLALLAGALAFALPMRGARGLIVWTGMIGGGVLAWTQATPDFRARMVSLTNLEQDYNYTSDSGRKAVWARGRAYWRANPVLGVGAGNFGVAEGEFNADTGRTGKWSAAHNAYIQALAELGTFGGGLFIAMLLVGAAAAFPLWRGGSPSSRGPPRLHRPELLASLAASASAAYFLSHAYFSPLYGVLALIALADRTAKAEASGGGAVEPVGVAGTVRLPGQRGGLALVRFSSRPMMRGGVD